MDKFQSVVIIFCIIVFTIFTAWVQTWMKDIKTYEDILKSNCQRLIDEDIVSEASQARLTKDFKCYLKTVTFWGSTWREATKEELNLLPY